jgi:geranylgeranyl pyrophosphate synthase
VHGSRRAVLLGDVIFATALQRTAELGREEVLTLSRAIAMLAAGAYKEPLDAREIDSAMANDTLAQPLYERIIYLKTGALFAAAAELGAIAAQATPLLRGAAVEFGARMGEAYQIADDLEDLVAHAGSSTISPQQRASLASLCAYFDMAPNGRAAISRTKLLDRNIGELIAAMEAEIARRIALARQALESFPERPRLAMLRALPAMIVEPVVTAAKRARDSDVVVVDCERR